MINDQKSSPKRLRDFGLHDRLPAERKRRQALRSISLSRGALQRQSRRPPLRVDFRILRPGISPGRRCGVAEGILGFIGGIAGGIVDRFVWRILQGWGPRIARRWGLLRPSQPFHRVRHRSVPFSQLGSQPGRPLVFGTTGTPLRCRSKPLSNLRTVFACQEQGHVRRRAANPRQ
jgi:hypothetical protein